MSPIHAAPRRLAMVFLAAAVALLCLEMWAILSRLASFF
jgi:hypothetical protein